ncbi:histidine phosphatase family protein [Deltaproteobacteria bacterium]|nr:histidine phosphatase family protein [Deltaproteobacteria bacterium]
MKTLYLARHAKSSWKYPNLDDFERPLNKRGRKNALFMGEILNKLKVAPDLVISSPANRAAMTARIIAYAINYPLEKIQYRETIYSSGENVLIHFIGQINDAAKEVMLIGHNPGFTDLANYMSDQRISNIPTCGVFCVGFNISSWEEIGEHRGKLKFFEFPKKFAS